ncbi:MAG TPA: AAA family ATPase [Gaiellaceae bacterium]|nr:AAA family ATPase [Gaiellaceae bacterium]
MTHSIRTLVALDEGVDREALQALLPIDPEIQIVGVVDGLEDSWTTLQETPTDLLVVACPGYSDRALFLVDGAVKQRPERPVVVVCDGPANGFVRRVFEAGADDLLTLPQSQEDLLFALRKAVARRQGAGAATGVALSPMICVLGPKGGTGKTLTSCNLAVSLAQSGHKVAVVDLDLQFGDVGLALGITPERTLYELAKSGGSLDDEKLDGYLATHRSGARVLIAPTRPDHAGVVTTEFLREVYTALRTSHEYVIVDTPPGFTPEVIASIDSSSHVCMVGMLDSLSLKNTKLGFETLELMGYEGERMRLVLNRADSRVGITLDDVVSIIGRKPDVLVPSDRDIPRSVNEGTPIVLAKARSGAAKAFRSLAAMYEPADASTNGHRRKRGRKH